MLKREVRGHQSAERYAADGCLLCFSRHVPLRAHLRHEFGREVRGEVFRTGQVLLRWLESTKATTIGGIFFAAIRLSMIVSPGM